MSQGSGHMPESFTRTQFCSMYNHGNTELKFQLSFMKKILKNIFKYTFKDIFSSIILMILVIYSLYILAYKYKNTVLIIATGFAYAS